MVARASLPANLEAPGEHRVRPYGVGPDSVPANLNPMAARDGHPTWSTGITCGSGHRGLP